MIDWFKVSINQGDAKAEYRAYLNMLTEAVDSGNALEISIAMKLAKEVLEKDFDIYAGAES